MLDATIDYFRCCDVPLEGKNAPLKWRQTFTCDLESISSHLRNCGSISVGLQLHGMVVVCGLEYYTYVGNLLISMYKNNGQLDHAVSAFEHVVSPNVISWNSLIAAYSDCRMFDEAWNLYYKMDLEPSEITFMSMLGICTDETALDLGKYVHADSVCIGLDSVMAVGNALVTMYGRCGDLESTCMVFEKMNSHNVISWTAILNVFCDLGQGREAIDIFNKMNKQEGVIPDRIAAVGVLNACASTGALAEGQTIHTSICCGLYEIDNILGNALINMYGKCGALDEACVVFDNLVERNIVTWTSLLTAYSEYGLRDEAFEVFERMEQQGFEPDQVTFSIILSMCEGPPHLRQGENIHVRLLRRGSELDVVTGTALVTMYGKCRCLGAACLVFNKMDQHNVISWNALLLAHSLQASTEDAYIIFLQMLQLEVIPDEASFASMFDSCTNPTALRYGYSIHAMLVAFGLESDILNNSLINMYGKCAAIEGACIVFNKVPQQTLSSWNTMFATCAKHGLNRQLLVLYQQLLLREVQPDHVTCLCFLSACSHAGLLAEGHSLFSCMTERYSIAPDLGHYNCMVDMLGRAGCLNAAERMMLSMPFQPDMKIWMSFLRGCRIYREIDRGKNAATHILELDSQFESAYVLLSNIICVE